MFFHSLSSLLIFLPFIFTSYPLIKNYNNNIGNFYLLLFSLFFYSYDKPWFVIPLLFSSICDYFISKKLIGEINATNSKRLILLIFSILINIGLLITFKYSNLIISTFNLESSPYISDQIQSIIIPVGISFYTFQTLSFSIDAFNKKIKFMPSFCDYLLYVSYFPQLVAGPILRPSDFFDKKSKLKLNENSSDIKNGFTRICYGLFLKLCLADEIGALNDLAYSSDFYTLSFLDAWTMAFGFGIQIYFDFSAYSHMAIGISKIIGLPIRENFKFPYLSLSSTEFWRRWHISLSSWVSDYLYELLNRKLPKIFYGFIPLLITWAIMGIWHGSSWKFAVWGLLNGVFVLIHRIFKKLNWDIKKVFNLRIISWSFTLFCTMSTWIFFRSNNWEQASYLYKNLFKITTLNLGLKENYYLIVFTFSLGILISGLIFHSKYFKNIVNNIYIRFFSSTLALIIAIIFLNRQNTFIYFQF